MIGVIDVGGGLRGIYGAGVFDYCLDKNIYFDYCIGVSAGSANVASYIASQKGRNFSFFTDYIFRQEYMSLKNYLRKGSYIDLDYVYSTLSNQDGENPLDYKALSKSPSRMIVVATDAATGEAVYFDKNDVAQDSYHILKASSNLPVICKPYPFQGKMYYDGGISDPVPIRKAFLDGCDNVVVILTKPIDFLRRPGKDKYFAMALKRKFPNTAKKLANRYQTYNNEVQLAKEYVAQGKAIILAPDDCCGVDTLTKDAERLKLLYKKGYQDGEKIAAFLDGIHAAKPDYQFM